MRFGVAPGPHTAPIASVSLTMRRVLYALTPAAIAHVWFFGSGFAINFFVAAATALVAEATVLKLRRRPTREPLSDGSALVTAALLSFAIPPLAPWWIPAFGAACAIVLAKHLYGGLGRNLFNPAMVGYVILLVSFPVELTQWIPPRMGDLDYRHLGFLPHLIYSLTGALPGDLTVDALTRATPLDLVREGLRSAQTFSEVRASSLFGGLAGRGWEWINSFIAIGGLYLLYTGTIRWHIPIMLLAGLLVPATLLYLLDADSFATPGFHLFSGATLLGAFFIATDPVSAAESARGRLIFGAGIGLLTYCIRTWGGYPDGMAFSVLLMNSAVPLIDRYTRPRIYGRN
ncbi:RnfABCDGE type electron transport complex subunit D [Candidatus Rariloculus sp.]|uniref:RnfABCDGE type electron transport complex subunit D n=1 Tax=Candidatus Rariloculus sp. TaxID=3101265 RepID=UPI003D09D5DF